MKPVFFNQVTWNNLQKTHKISILESTVNLDFHSTTLISTIMKPNKQNTMHKNKELAQSYWRESINIKCQQFNTYKNLSCFKYLIDSHLTPFNVLHMHISSNYHLVSLNQVPQTIWGPKFPTAQGAIIVFYISHDNTFCHLMN